MTDDDTCGEVLLVLTCELPPGHPEGEHQAEAPLPPVVNRMIAEQMNRLDLAVTAQRRAARWAWITAALWGFALASNLIATFFLRQ